MDKQFPEVHEAIKRRFNIKYMKDVLPISTPGRSSGRELFGQLFADLKFTVGAEIGVRRGEFSAVLLKANPELKLYCIDPWMAYQRYDQDRQDRIYAEAVRNLSGLDAVFIRKTSMEALADIKDRSLDFGYIDGNHEFDYAVMDLICWVKKVKIGGIVALHDYHAGHWYGVMQAVNAYTHCHRIDPWFVTKSSQPTAFWVNAPEEYNND